MKKKPVVLTSDEEYILRDLLDIIVDDSELRKSFRDTLDISPTRLPRLADKLRKITSQNLTKELDNYNKSL